MKKIIAVDAVLKELAKNKRDNLERHKACQAYGETQYHEQEQARHGPVRTLADLPIRITTPDTKLAEPFTIIAPNAPKPIFVCRESWKWFDLYPMICKALICCRRDSG